MSLGQQAWPSHQPLLGLRRCPSPKQCLQLPNLELIFSRLNHMSGLRLSMSWLPSAPEALAQTPDKESLVTAGGGQGPDTGPDRGAAARGISDLGAPSLPLSAPPTPSGRQTKERGQRDSELGIQSSCFLPLPGLWPCSSSAPRVLTPAPTRHQQKIP